MFIITYNDGDGNLSNALRNSRGKNIFAKDNKYQSELLKNLAVLKDVSNADLSTYSVLETGRHVWNEETNGHYGHGHHILENDNKQ